MPEYVNIHASCVLLNGAGKPFGAPANLAVLLIGESGAGKSDLTVRLIERGAVLVADDRCDLAYRDGALSVSAPANLTGLLELRGVGILTFPFAAAASVGLVARLQNLGQIPRYPDPQRYRPPADLHMPEAKWPPLITLAPFEASAPAKLIAAASAAAARCRPNPDTL
ncbi:MAG TPA: HPr kinase/phosphatase C-terminal domain-containing protein [Rhizomicrobium sp.]|jgi:serine kinase of HPr protein (carbohydrate metabolism regulator)